MRATAALASLLLALATPATAATFVVNDLGDEADANVGDGVCDIPIGGPPRCTLRAAMQEANATAAFDVIEFGLGLIVINVGSALPSITNHLLIDGRTAPSFNTAATSTIDAPPSVYIDGAGIGGTTADGFRVVGDALVEIHGLGITNFPDNGIESANGVVHLFDGNWIGVGRTGFAAGNGGAGVYLNDCERCIVGQEIPSTSPAAIEGLGNVIGNNDEDGVYVVLGEDNIIAGNTIGEDPVGSADFGNGGHGIHLLGPNNIIGQFRGVSADDFLRTPNVITNNGGDGIRTFTGGHLIYTNEVFGNDGHGVVLNGAGSRLGFVNVDMRNFIQGNGGHGVVIGDALASSNNLLRHNWIYQNSGRGVQLTNGSSNTLQENEIFDNGNDAVRLDSSGNEVFRNQIGLFLGFPVGNAANGVVVNAGNNIIHSNVIGLMADDGIDVVSGDGSTITGNDIGAIDGDDIGNAGVGIRVRNGPLGNSIDGNTIGFNLDGIRLEGSSSLVCGNLIGIDEEERDIGNDIEGVRVTGGGNVVGNASGGCPGNLIGHNGSDGIEVAGDANIVRDNTIGGIPGILAGNGAGGVLLTTGADLNEVAGNIIHNNVGAGVRVGGAAGTRNRIEDNNFRANGGIAIDLGDNGVTPNDAGDGDTGPNNLQNYPVFSAVAPGLGVLNVSYSIDSGLAASNYPIQVDFYVAGQDRREGYRVHSDSYNLAPGATRSISFDPGDDAAFLSAVAIDLEGNTSEFTAPVEYAIVPLSDDIFMDGFEDP